MNRHMLAVALALSISACTVVAPDPGYESVLVDKPIIFGHGGVRPETGKPGRGYTWFSTSEITVPVTPQALTVTFNDFASKDNILLDFSSTIQYRITDPALLVSKYGLDKWFDNNVHNQYLSIVREAVKSYTMTEMMSSPTAAAVMDETITKHIRSVVKEEGLPVEIMSISLGKAVPNQNVLTQMNETAAQQQRLKTLVQATEAEKQRELEQIAKAKADNAFRNNMNMSVEQYVAIEQARISAGACVKAANCIIAPTGTSVIVGK